MVCVVVFVGFPASCEDHQTNQLKIEPEPSSTKVVRDGWGPEREREGGKEGGDKG